MYKAATKCAVLVLALCVLCMSVGCSTEPPTKSAPDTVTVSGRTMTFVSAEQRRAWQEPLAQLLSNVLVPYGENGEILGYEATVDPHRPAIVQCYRCGLFDVTQDGTPELLVHPFGYFGSSGTATYFIYDIYTGQRLGEMSGGMGQLWSVYLDTEAKDFELIGQYWLRGGWSWRTRCVVTLSYDPAIPESYESEYLRSEHEIGMEEVGTQGSDDWIETYPDTTYYVYGREVSLDEYYATYEQFFTRYVRIPETDLLLYDWDEVAPDEEDYEVRGQKMAAALVASDQQFIDYSANETSAA